MLNNNLLAETFHRFSENEAKGKSPLYEQWCRRIGMDAELLTFL
ncbi:hypothetical protein ACTHOQ_02045 [Solibacillus silvestris]